MEEKKTAMGRALTVPLIYSPTNSPGLTSRSEKPVKNLETSSVASKKHKKLKNAPVPSLKTHEAPEYPALLSDTSDIFSKISQYINHQFASMASTSYTFSDVKVLTDETHAVGVTTEGYCVYLDLLTASSEEVLITKSPLSGILLYNSDKNALVKEKERGRVYCIEIPSMRTVKLVNLKGERGNGIGRMCITSNEEYCLARLWKGEIIRWKLSDMDKSDIMLSDKNVVCMNISPDGVVVLGMIDKRIVLYSTAFEKILEKNFEFQVDAFISFSSSGHLIILAMELGIKVIEKKSLGLVAEYFMGCLSYDCVMTRDNRYIISPLETGELAFIEVNSPKEPVKIKVHSTGVISAYLTQDEEYIYTFGKDSKFGKIKFPTLSRFRLMSEANFSSNTIMSSARSQDTLKDTLESEKKALEPEDYFKVLCICESQAQDIAIVGGHSNNLLVWDLKSTKKYGNLSGHQDYVYALECINDEVVASGSADCKIKIWNFRFLTLLCTLSGHTDCVTSLVRVDHWRLASGSRDCTVKIWEWEEKVLIYTISEVSGPVLSLLLPRPGFLMLGTNDCIQCWDLKGYCCMFEKKCENEVAELRLFDSDFEGNMRNYLALGCEENSFCIENPFTSRELLIVGRDEKHSYQFMNYIREIVTYRLPNYDASMDRLIVFPYRVNSLHFYAYYDMPEYLCNAILNGAPLINSEDNENPLSIAIALKNKDCVKAIIKTAWKIYTANPYFISSINSDTLLALNALNISVLPKLYNLLLVNYTSSIKYCSKKAPLPIVKSTFSQSISRKYILNEVFCNDNELEINFSHSSIPLYLDSGSTKSIEFLTSICKCEQQAVFNTELLQRYIDYKWNKSRLFLYLEGALFLVFYLHILVESLLIQEVIPIIIALPISLALTSIYTTHSFLSLSLSFWAVLDYVRFLLFLIYFILDFTSEASKELLIACVIACSIQGLYYFKLWRGTRKLVSIIIKVGYDVFSFLLLMMHVLIAMGAVLHVIASEEELHTTELVKLISISEESSSSFIEGLFLVFMSIVNPLIMLNILLALCADSYNQSEEKTTALDYKEMADIVLRIELLLVFKRSNEKMEYLQVSSLERKVQTDMFKKLSRIIKNVQKEQERGKVEVFEKLQDFEMKMKSLENILLGIKANHSPYKKKA